MLLMRNPWVSRRIAAAMISVGVLVTFVQVLLLIPAMGGRLVMRRPGVKG